jgi:hypothetical protein
MIVSMPGKHVEGGRHGMHGSRVPLSSATAAATHRLWHQRLHTRAHGRHYYVYPAGCRRRRHLASAAGHHLPLHRALPRAARLLEA